MEENKEIEIRFAKFEDLDILLDLRYELFVHENEILNNNSVNLSWVKSEKGIEDLKYFILNDESITLVALENDTIVGFICGELENKKPWDNNRYFILTNIYIKEEYRNMDIGKKLIKYFKNEINNRFNGLIDKIKVECLYNNINAIEFYKDLDFYENSIELLMDV